MNNQNTIYQAKWMIGNQMVAVLKINVDKKYVTAHIWVIKWRIPGTFALEYAFKRHNFLKQSKQGISYTNIINYYISDIWLSLENRLMIMGLSYKAKDIRMYVKDISNKEDNS